MANLALVLSLEVKFKCRDIAAGVGAWGGGGGGSSDVTKDRAGDAGLQLIHTAGFRTALFPEMPFPLVLECPREPEK